MNNVLILLDNLGDWKPYYETSSVLTVSDYLKNKPVEKDRKLVINLSNDYSYNSGGYYYMAKGHWQIYCHYDSGRSRCGLVDTISIYQVPRVVLDTAVKAANLIGKGLYGVDLKMVDDKAYVIEINDNSSIDHGLEDAIIGDEIYYRLLNHFEQVLEAKHY